MHTAVTIAAIIYWFKNMKATEDLTGAQLLVVISALAFTLATAIAEDILALL